MGRVSQQLAQVLPDEVIQLLGRDEARCAVLSAPPLRFLIFAGAEVVLVTASSAGLAGESAKAPNNPRSEQGFGFIVTPGEGLVLPPRPLPQFRLTSCG